MIERAKLLSTEAHSYIGQVRKYTREPYIIHPTNVAYLVEIFGGTEDMIASAYLHDVLEDVFPHAGEKFGPLKISTECGVEVLRLVEELTDESTLEDGNREKRKEIDRIKLHKVSPEAKTIKVADLIDNCLTICKYDMNFAKVYLKEKENLLEVLNDCSHPKILELSYDLLIKNKKLLENNK